MDVEAMRPMFAYIQKAAAAAGIDLPGLTDPVSRGSPATKVVARLRQAGVTSAFGGR
jgi:hypothetical protein